MTFHSYVEPRGFVPFPTWSGERVYMVPLTNGRAPAPLVRWQPTIDAMLDGIPTPLQCYLMVDQGFVKAGTTQRRPGLHIDGYWMAGGQPSGHLAKVGGHQQPGTHMHTGHWAPTGWGSVDSMIAPEAILLASDVMASIGYQGMWEGPIGERGDCSHVNTEGLKQVDLEAHRCFAGNVTFLHASTPVPHDTPRTLVRLNVPGWTPA